MLVTPTRCASHPILIAWESSVKRHLNNSASRFAPMLMVLLSISSWLKENSSTSRGCAQLFQGSTYLLKCCCEKLSFHNLIMDDMLSNKKLKPIVTELFVRGRKLNSSLVFITQFYFAVLKILTKFNTSFFFMKIPNKRELKQIACNHSSNTHSSDTYDFMNLYKT